MNLGHRRVEILDPRLFLRKLVLLLVFSAAFVPLKYYELDQVLLAYVVLLVALHAYFLMVLIWRVRWKVLAQDRRSFLLRLLAIAFFVFLLAILETGVGFVEFLVFLAASLVIHTLLLLSLSLIVRPMPTSAPTSIDST